MRICITILLLSAFSLLARADHITGGEMFYSYSGFSNGQYQYQVTLKLYMRCNSGRQFPNPAIISVFERGNNTRLEDIPVAMQTQHTIQITDPDPCITDPPQVCYEVAYYSFSFSVPSNQAGYLLASQVNYRINGIANLDGSTLVGATYTCEIPGTQSQANGPVNNSAFFTGSDLVIVCKGNFFTYSFVADDADGDELRYSFCAAYRSSSSGINGVAAGDPPYNAVPYRSPTYSASTPLGIRVTIDPITGLISGVAPPGGMFVVTVCVSEIRNGTVIATQRKDLQINVTDCSVAAASLEEDYMLCNTSQTASISNLSNSPLIVSHSWTVLSPSGTTLLSTHSQYLNYTFPGNGTYTIKLIVNERAPCSDSTSAPVYVYPGLDPDFTATGICITKPTVFSDRTTNLSGTINSWQWDFGETSATSDFSSLQDPVYTYPSTGIKTASLVVTTTDGCRDTVFKTINIVDRPPVSLAFRDTLICLNDRLQLQASGPGNFSWTPAQHISNVNTANPFVTPPVSTTYYVDYNIDGCMNRDSVLVRVTDRVNLQAMRDTVICSGDTIQLQINSDALRYEWTPASQLTDPRLQNPGAITTVTTLYQVIAFIGGCSAGETIKVTAIPYPVADAGKDTVICYNTLAQLQAFTDGSSWAWMPASSISNTSLLNPTASPASTLAYVFTASDTKGCPKQAIDTVIVTVLPKIFASAGRDTSVVIGQSLQLQASGGETYSWSPAFSLSSVTVADPVALFNEPSNGLRYKVEVYNSEGCYDSAFVFIKVFGSLPTVFVPTAFTPNNDGLNDVLRPVVAGMQRFDYFQVYNRWGQLVFSTSTDGDGWDGKVNGQYQSNNIYVWMVKAVDYNGAPYFKKGTVAVVR